MFPAFASSVPLLRGSSPRRATCAARRRRSPRASAEEWEAPPAEWESAGSNVPSRGLQEIEFIIRPDGMVEEKVTGVRGKDCVKLTEKIEKALGRVTHKEKTEQFFEEVYDTVQEKEVIKEMIQLQPDDPLYVADPNIPSW